MQAPCKTPAVIPAAVGDLLESVTRLHLVGIGGVSMCALADVLHQQGYRVTGSDMQAGDAVARLRAKGITVHIGHQAETIASVKPGAIIRTAAVREDNPEIQAARASGIPIVERAQAWGFLMRRYEQVLCIAGTHGKTTTTGMAAQIALAADLDPTLMLGGTLPAIGAGHRLGGDKLMVFESCEYCNSFLAFLPTIAVILNVEADHLDFFSGLEEIQASFAAFAALVPENGAIVVNGDDPNALACLTAPELASRRVLRFGSASGCEVQCRSLTVTDGLPHFEIWADDSLYARVGLLVPGDHNVSNALAAAAAAYALGLEGDAVARGLGAFVGTGRRFQRLGSFQGADVVDDYAHHPTEVAATLRAARGMGYKRILCAFQPHTYTRTAALFDDFVTALRLADKVYMAEIYAAREAPTGLSANTLAQAIDGAVYFETLPALEDALAADAQPGDLILTMGAGNINQVGLGLCTRKG